jgi:hypothetical protein
MIMKDTWIGGRLLYIILINNLLICHAVDQITLHIEDTLPISAAASPKHSFSAG